MGEKYDANLVAYKRSTKLMTEVMKFKFRLKWFYTCVTAEPLSSKIEIVEPPLHTKAPKTHQKMKLKIKYSKFIRAEYRPSIQISIESGLKNLRLLP